MDWAALWVVACVWNQRVLEAERHSLQLLYFIWASLVAQLVKNLPVKHESGVDPWIRKIPWRRVWQPILAFLPGESHGLRSLAATVHGAAKSQTGLSE